MPHLLLIAVFLPAAGALLLPVGRRWARLGALGIAVAVLGMAVVLAMRYSPVQMDAEPFALTDWHWLESAGVPIDIRFSLSLDGLSLWLFGLTALLTVVAVQVGWEAIDERASLYYRLLLLLETGMLGVFAARDIILFYVFFECTLIPLFFLIGIWGGHERRHAAMKFFLFTLAGSLLTFLGLLTIVLWVYYHPIGTPAVSELSFSIPNLTESLRAAATEGQPMPLAWQIAIFLALFAGFAIKTPLWPLHTWLPLAHVEAPTAGSVLLAGVLLKIGTYGFARFSLPMLPQAAAALMPWLMWIALAGVLYGAMVALAQSDIKRLVAYSSVSHLGFCMLGLFALDGLSVQGGLLQMVNHGLATGGLFAVVGMIYERFHTREIGDFGGLARRMPRLAFFALVLTLSSIALPGLAGFAGEFPLLLGVFQRGWAATASPHDTQLRVIAVLSLGGVVLGAWYMLWMYQRVFFGEPHNKPNSHELTASRELTVPGEPAPPVRDLSLREVCTLTPLVIMIFWIGLQPQFFLDRMRSTVDDLMQPAMRAVEERGEKGEARREKANVSASRMGRASRVGQSQRSPTTSTAYSVLRTPYAPRLALLPSPFAPLPSLHTPCPSYLNP
jgi:NADH-quinone oxidoreductase subunit M